MIEVKIDCWKLKSLFQDQNQLYEHLYSFDEKWFTQRTPKFELNEEGKIKNESWADTRFYINDLNKIDINLLKYCELSPVGILEMMGGAKIKTENVLEVMKRNQIMLPNNMMLEMKELKLETDACTDSINELMNDGWKLIAILPQHQQRRPDYILGRM
jgi:hypothetical protein